MGVIYYNADEVISKLCKILEADGECVEEIFKISVEAFGLLKRDKDRELIRAKIKNANDRLRHVKDLMNELRDIVFKTVQERI